ncbi:unnamed protein product [Peronospora belbahrii]|uniref:BSD domain-containing protein n=1 Tax=Peronospora belbahrii TaxID=622444 RepID=A0AAU9LD96_9STRA|nr:unnamed protein product [Peronospora belbahrii]CAH0518791.1 unnamed protein product [Peronospora belbahrii]
MWKLLEQAAKNASINASSYVLSVHEKAQTLAAAVQDEASALLSNAMGSARSGPVDEILFEEVADYQQFLSFFSIEEHKHEIKRALDEDADICALHDTIVPLELSYDEFWCRYFFRQQQAEQREKIGQKQDVVDTKKSPEENREKEYSGDEALNGDYEHRPQDMQLSREKADCEDQEGLWILKAARDAERRAATQWRQKARDLHHQVHEIKLSYDEKEQKAVQEWEKQLQTLCDRYETKMAALTLQISEARAAGYGEGIRESQAALEGVQQKAKEDTTRLRCEICEGVFGASVEERIATLTKEKENLQKKLIIAREQIVELEKRGGIPAEKAGDTAYAELTKEKDLWRIKALKMKKLKDFVHAELTTLRQQRDAPAGSDSLASGIQSTNSDDHRKLQTRMDELQTQLATALVGSEAQAREAYEKGIETGKAEADQRAKRERDVAYQEGYKKAQADVKSEMGVLKAELQMFRAFHESAAHCADHVDENIEDLLDGSLDDISLAEGQALCSPTSSVSIFTDNGKNDFSCESTNDWGEW